MILSQSVPGLLKRLALISAGLTGGNAMAIASELQVIPERVIEDVIEESEGDEWSDLDRLRVLQLLALDPRASVRRDVAMSLLVRPEVAHPAEAEALLANLARDPDPGIGRLAADALARHRAR